MMSSQWGEEISTTCRQSGYWSHTFLTTLRLTFPECKSKVKPVSFKARMVVTFSGMTCPPESASEIFDFVQEQKFRGLLSFLL